DVRLVFMMPAFHQSPFKILDRSLPGCDFRLPMPNQCVVPNRPVLLTGDFSQVYCDHTTQTCDPCTQFLITPHPSPPAGIGYRTADHHNLSILCSLGGSLEVRCLRRHQERLRSGDVGGLRFEVGGSLKKG